jgi:hypothetical protein
MSGIAMLKQKARNSWNLIHTCPENVTNYVIFGPEIYEKRILYNLDQQNVFLKWNLEVCEIE